MSHQPVSQQRQIDILVNVSPGAYKIEKGLAQPAATLLKRKNSRGMLRDN
jgi:hypothetical protein